MIGTAIRFFFIWILTREAYRRGQGQPAMETWIWAAWFLGFLISQILWVSFYMHLMHPGQGIDHVELATLTVCNQVAFSSVFIFAGWLYGRYKKPRVTAVSDYPSLDELREVRGVKLIESWGGKIKNAKGKDRVNRRFVVGHIKELGSASWLAGENLNLTLAACCAIKIFAGSSLQSAGPMANTIQYLLWSLLTGWIAWVAYQHFRNNPPETLPYSRFSAGDYCRWFAVLWLSWYPVAALTEFGFFLYVLAAVSTGMFLIAYMASELFSRKERGDEFNAVIVGGFLFCLMLGNGILDGVRAHYGVPILGHFLQSPSFEARYHADLTLYSENDSFRVIKGSAVIQVEDGWLASGDNDAGYQVKEITVTHIYTPSKLVVSQDGRNDENSFMVNDNRGRTWGVKIRDPYLK